GGPHPLASGLVRDAEGGLEPSGHRPLPVAPPGLLPVEGGDQLEHRGMRGGHDRMQLADGIGDLRRRHCCESLLVHLRAPWLFCTRLRYSTDGYRQEMARKWRRKKFLSPHSSRDLGSRTVGNPQTVVL